MKTFKIKTWGEEYEVYLRLTTYVSNNNTAIAAETVEGEPFCIMTVNLDKLPEDEACIDTNNDPWAEDFLVQNGFSQGRVGLCESGFCTYPVHKLNLEALREVSL